MLPNFLIIGAAKSGTTSLYHYLRAHPQVFMPATKELAFFIKKGNWSRGLEWYKKQFEGGENAASLGEASPQYSMYPVHSGVPERISRLLPDVRLIYVVRHPIERMRSHYLEHLAYGANEGPIKKALVTYPIYLNVSRYALQIEHYLEYFPREQLLVIASEQLRSAREQSLRRVFAFLGINYKVSVPIVEQEFNKIEGKRVRRPLFRIASRFAAYQAMKRFAPAGLRKLARPLITQRSEKSKISIPEDLRRWLTDLLRDDVRRLYRYMDDSFDGWGIEGRPPREVLRPTLIRR
jgi:hypothetical protein